jgi:hypothetical protein
MRNYLRNVHNRYVECKMLSIAIGWHWTDFIFIISGRVL